VPYVPCAHLWADFKGGGDWREAGSVSQDSKADLSLVVTLNLFQGPFFLLVNDAGGAMDAEPTASVAKQVQHDEMGKPPLATIFLLLASRSHISKLAIRVGF
jgi:hypothetical protein